MVQITNNRIVKMIIKVSIFLIFVYLVYVFTEEDKKTNSIESFINKQNQEHEEYIKYSETLLHNKDQSLKDLYKNYSGEGSNKKEWENMNLHQCIDRCNQLDGCVGFSRENVNDNEKASCYPKSIISQCHSSRKGNFEQRQNALNFNTYIKVNTKNQLTKCIGDEAVTMDRHIFIKSFAYPNKYIGIKNNKVEMITKGDKQIGMFLYCKFKIEVGKEGSGTVSFQHIESGKYLGRTKNDLINCIKLDSSTDTKQRVSFYLHDGLSNQIILKCLPLKGEKLSRYVALDRNAKYLKAITKVELNKNNNNFMELMTFDIVDFITDNTIISSKNNFKNIRKRNTNNRHQNNMNNNMNNNTHNETFVDSTPYSLSNESINDNDKNQEINDRINKNRMDIHQYLESGLNINDFMNEQESNIESRQINIGPYQSLSDIDIHFNKTLDDKRYEDNSSQGEQTYNKLREINNTLYKDELGIEKKMKNNSNRIDNVNHKINNMRLTDMSRDYNYLKSLLDNTGTPTPTNPPELTEEPTQIQQPVIN